MVHDMENTLGEMYDNEANRCWNHTPERSEEVPLQALGVLGHTNKTPFAGDTSSLGMDLWNVQASCG